MSVKHKNIFFKPNKVIRYLVLSDFVFWSGWGFLTPIFAIFILNRIQGGNVFVVGMAFAIFWITRSLFRIPISILLDACPAEKDDYLVLIVGLFLAAMVPFGYIIATKPIHIYLLQGLHGFSLAMSYAGWTGIFTRHIDIGRESTEWGLNASTIGIGIGIGGAIGGWGVTRFGFIPIFLFVGIFSLVGVMILSGLRSEIKGVLESGSADP